ncbi:MAG: Ig-like domain-containing protein, partial [Propionibacteriaceae bacterium]|nr:Ig-like domain-containing protein [Propionibacteriaceae bacterium]
MRYHRGQPGTAVAAATIAKWLAGLTAFAVLIGAVVATGGWLAPGAEAAGTGAARLVQVLGKFDKFYTLAAGNGATDSEFRLDFVMEVPAGAVKADGTGLELKYDFNGTYTGTYGPGIQADNQTGGTWYTAGTLITTPNLAYGNINQEYRIVRIDHFGPTDRVTISMQGDLGGNYDAASLLPGHAPYQRPVTMQAHVTGNGLNQYFSYQYEVTVFDTEALYAPDSQEKVAAMVGWDWTWPGLPVNSQTSWGYVVGGANPAVPAGMMVVAFESPWYGLAAAVNAGECTDTTSFYYQWLRNDGSPTSLTPTPVRQTITPTNAASTATLAAGTLVDMSPTGSLDFSAEGPGYYRLVAWPIAVNPNQPSCNGSDYYTGSVGDLASQNAFTVGSVFYTGGNIATSVLKDFEPNPMAYEGTSEAVYTLDSGQSRISGVGFTDTLPANLVFTGITEDNCGFANQRVTQADVDAMTDPVLAANIELGPVLSLVDMNNDGALDTINLQGGVTYDIQTGASEVFGADTLLGQTCVIKVGVTHTAAVTGNSVCTNPTAAAAQTNNASNVSYQSLTTVLGYDSTSDTAFGDCLDITMQSDLTPTGATAEVLPGTVAGLTTTVTSAGPSEIDTAGVTITAPAGTTLADVDPACTVNAASTVATCTTGWLKSGETRTYAYSVAVPAGAALGVPLTGSVATTYAYDTNPANDSAAITLTPEAVDVSHSYYTVSGANIVADGVATGTITASLTDTDGHSVTQEASLLTGSLATLDPTTTISAFTETATPGTYAATILSSTTGDKVVQVVEGITPLTAVGNTTAHFVAGPFDWSASSFAVSPGVDVGDQSTWVPVSAGDQFYTGTLTARDANNNPVTGLNLTDITFEGDFGVTVTKVAEGPAGTYTAQFSSTVPSATATASVLYKGTLVPSGTGVTQADQVKPTPFRAGAPSVDLTCAAGQTGTSLTATTPVVIGRLSAVKAVVTDAFCNPLAGVDVTFAAMEETADNSATFVPTQATTGDDGSATVMLTDSQAETVVVTASFLADGEPLMIGMPNPVVFYDDYDPTIVDSAMSQFAVSPAATTDSSTWVTVSDGGSVYTGTFTAKNSRGQTIDGLDLTDIVFTASDPAVQLAATVTPGPVGTGTYLMTFWSTTASDPAAVPTATVSYQGTVIGVAAPVPFQAGSPVINPTCPAGLVGTNLSAVTPVAAGDPAGSAVTAYVTDAYCNPVPGATVTFQTTEQTPDGSATFDQVTATTGADGDAVVTLADALPEWVNVTASVTVDGTATPITAGSPARVVFTGEAVVSWTNSSFTVSPVATSDPASWVAVSAGDQVYTATLVARDGNNEPMTGLDATQVVFGATSLTVVVAGFAETTPGTYQATYASPVAQAGALAKVAVKGVTAPDTRPIPFRAGGLSLTRSVFT